MADFVSKSITKSAERKLTTPIDTVAFFLAFVQDILDNNPWGCTSYESGGSTIAAVVRGTEYYTGKVVYKNSEAKTVGQITIKAPTSSTFSPNVNAIILQQKLMPQ